MAIPFEPLIELFIVVTAHTLSLFNAVVLLWLGLTVLLTGNRRRPATIAGSAGLLLGSIFFGGHTLVLTATPGTALTVVWRVMWVVAIAAPYFWGLTIFYYAGDLTTGRWVRRVLTAAALLMLLAHFVISPLPSFYQFILAQNLNPVVAVAYVPYVFLCFTLPLIALRRPRSVDAGGRFPMHPPDRFRRARPWLVGAASMLALAVIVFAYTAYAIIPRAIPINNLTTGVLREIFMADSVVSGFIALAIVLLGRAVLANNVLIERVQSSQGFFSRWRNVVMILLLGSFFITFLYTTSVSRSASPIYSLLLTTVLAVVAYAMFNWIQHVERQDFMNRLRPFVSSLNLGDRLIAPGSSDGWSEARELFTALCRDALQAEYATLQFDAPPSPPDAGGGAGLRRLDYHWNPEREAILTLTMPQAGDWNRLDADHWVWPLSDSRGSIGQLVLGPKLSGTEYTAQELQVAAACAERILDASAGEQIAQVALRLLRQRIAEVQVMSTRHKRVLHDDVLPQVHLALLKLESLKRQPARWEAELDEVTRALTETHRRAAMLVREMSNAVPTRLESEGLVAALHSALTHDFRDSFDEIAWQASPDATEYARGLPLFVSEVIFYAVQEAIRNSARHGRGGDPDRKLRLDVSIYGPPGLKVVVGDDGVGRNGRTGAALQNNGAAGAGSGLLFHSAMLAVVGGTLAVLDRPGGGTQVFVELPHK